MLFDILTKSFGVSKNFGPVLPYGAPALCKCMTGVASAEKRRSHAEIGGALLPRGFGSQRLVDGDEPPVTDGDFSVYDGIIDRPTHADRRQHGLRIITGTGQLEPAAVDQEQVAALSGFQRADVAAAKQGSAPARGDFQKIVAGRRVLA